ncbi:MAG TPA: rhodanese-like domain-containing protein [Streptosporangiaceae bacterium]|nr:rhodanese-like domain-containing protein [Streptosporangiaceae bacterium]
MVEVLQIETPTLGDRSYLVHDGETALVIDPQRDIDRVIAMAADAGVRVTHVAETHVHNDYVTGGFALARAACAAYLVNADDPVSFDRTPVSDGDLVEIGGMRVRVLATPGHTYSHLAYVVEAGGDMAGVFTGGSLLYGSTGRTDLLGPAAAEALSHAQWASAHRLARELPDTARIFPTHGFGSFCAAGESQAAVSSTIGQEKLVNPALTLDERAYVESLLAGLDAWPAYYAHMAPANLAGPADIDLSPPRPADAAELRRRIEAGEWVVDLRDRVAFAAGYVPGTFSFPLDGSFATYLGWMIPWGMPLTLLGDSPEQVAVAQRELARIGIDRPAAAATGRPETWAGERGVTSLRLATFGDLATTFADGGGHRPIVLDVRRRLEWEEGHIAGAVHIPLHELAERLGELADGSAERPDRTADPADRTAEQPGRPDEQLARSDEQPGRADEPSARSDEQPGRGDERPGRGDEQPGQADEPPGRHGEIPPGEVWVHCGAGYRSVVAASILAARGRRVVAVNDDFANAATAGLPLDPA